ncbi:MAG: tRNA (adenosine(37)-N6)-threonylcarbamoyltransferase complex transferase subunit TsaD [Dehalococcoidia bacterium]|nr:tRNA (adenosine(37)-N6)-threonylcarbamoyltransferase complex transferase subunit TsaD [Dehalococcoidia bacterium]
MLILGIESSCDETAAAVVADGRRVRSNVVASQQLLHAETGGVVPEVAAREHLRALPLVVRQALREAECDWDDLDYVAATVGPGLPGALLVGLNGARGLAYARGLSLIPVDHIEGHVCANWLLDDEPPLPALALVISGGHTELLLMEDHGRYQRLGGTRDDAAGEAFDKVARLLDLGYPGGPPVSRLAATAPERRLKLPRAWLSGSDDFSFSGLKTAVLHTVQAPDAPPAAEVAWAFEESVADVLSKKAARAAEREGVASVLVAGGVAANRRIRERIEERSSVPVFIPPPDLCTDNAAMIAAAAFRHLDDARPAEAPLDIRPMAYRSRVR